ncbi:hypothetical protein SLEP1_g2955 [Rubroshorea leprosula]|uniref:RNase H type-1 domain-containing protein n=1 Tax=Rubroshorea leprosula TaxID=152421 RepID=A0AAV5HR50_9ROSI|nr:hypothetical protein SLEP1_g2955 [Rubroshorea leprosula]
MDLEANPSSGPVRAGNPSQPLGQGQLPNNLPPHLPPQIPNMFPLVDHAKGGDENQPHNSTRNSASTANQDVVTAQLAAMQQQFGVFQLVLAQLLTRNNPGDPLINFLNPAPQPPAPQQDPQLVQHAPTLSESQVEQRGAPPLHHNTDSIAHPLNTNITLEPYPTGFKIPQLETYDGTKDPDDHLHAFYSCMQAHNAFDAFMYKIFPFTLHGNARTWDGESLKNYMSRFNDGVLKVSSFNQAVGIATVIQGLQHERFRNSLIKHPATPFNEVNDRSLKFITIKEYALSQKPVPPRNQNLDWRDEGQSRKRMKTVQNRGPMMTSPSKFGKPNSVPLQQNISKTPVTWTPFNLLRSQIFMQIKNKMDLRSKLESLAQKGMLNEYIQRIEQPKFVREQGAQLQGSRNAGNKQGMGYQQAPPPLPPLTRIIHMITGGLEAGVVTPHNDPLVTSVMINNCEVQRVLVDTGSAPDIMYFHYFESLGLDPTLLHRYDGLIYGFNNKPVQVEGVLTLNVAFGSGQTYANGKWQMCIDYTNLNQACPKDCYTMPSIDKLVEKTSGNERLSLLDAYSSYHQVPMAPEDEEKTLFYTGDEIYCYVMMPFGLKNAGATYQKMVTIIFRAQIGRNLEVYIDDIVIFGVEFGKFIGFMVSRRGIEVNPEKIRVIAEMEPPKSVKNIQRLTGRVTALHRFISKSADKCLPFFKIMRSTAQKDESGKQKKFEWNQECQATFDELKAYLSSPPLLTKAIDGEILYLYLGISNECALSHSTPNPEPNDWTLYVDGVSSSKGSRAGALLIGPYGYRSEHALKFNFDATNNMAEYEALLLGLQLALELKVMVIQMYSDSQLVVNQVNSICEVVDLVMMKYVALVAELKSVFVEVLDEPSFMKPRMMEISTNSDTPSWTDPIISFLQDEIVLEDKQEAMRYGIPNQIDADNESNGMVESINNAILEGIKPRLEQHKARWADELNNVLWAYRTMSRTTTGETPYHLAFGIEVVIPIEIGVPSFRVTHFNEGRNGQLLRENLDLLTKVREEAWLRTLVYKQKLANFYNKRVCPRTFKIRDLVLRKAGLTGFETRFGKLAPNWEGPYTMAKVPHPGAYVLQDAEGKQIRKVWNVNNLKKFYP